MPESAFKMIFDADDRSAMQRLQKMEDKVNQLTEALKKVKQEGRKSSQETGDGFGKLDGAIGGVVRQFGAMAAGFLSLQKGVDILKQYDEYLGRIASKSSRSAMGLAQFDLLQSPGQVRAAEAKLAKIAAPIGAGPEQAGSIAQTIQSLYGGDFDKAQSDIGTALKLGRLGVDEQTLRSMAIASIPKGIPIEKAANAFYRAAQISPLEPVDIGRVAPALVAYKDTMTGISAAAALAEGGMDPEELRQRVMALSMGVAMKSDLTKKATRLAGKDKKTYDDLTEIEQLDYIRKVVKDTDHNGQISQIEVMKSGINEIRQAQAIAGAINRFDTLKRTRAEIENAPIGLVGAEYQKIMESPGQQLRLQEEQLAAANAWQLYLGPQAEKGRTREGSAIAAGANALTEGGGFMNDTETGKRSTAGRIWDATVRGLALSGSVGPGQASAPMQTNAPQVPATPEAAINRLIDALNATADTIIEGVNKAQSTEAGPARNAGNE